MRRLLTICLTTIGAFAVVFIIAAVLILHGSSSSENSDSNSSTPTSAPASTPTSNQPAQQPTFSLTSGNATYYGAMTSNVGVAILGVRDIGQYLSSGWGDATRADGKFIAVGVGINNRQNTAITMDTGLFELLDSSGNVYSASEKSMEVAENNNLFLAQINPGVTKAGLIVFDVPQNLGLDGLQLKYRGGMTGDSAILPLKVNSTVQQAAEPSGPNPQPSGSAEPNAQNTASQPSDATSTSQAITPAQ